MNILQIVGLTAASLFIVGAGCGKTTSRPSKAPAENPPETTIFSLREQENSGERGTAYLIPQADGTTKVSVELTAAAQILERKAHLHTGTCEQLGDIVYSLNELIDGKSDTIVNARAAQLTGEPRLVLAAHKGKAMTKIACGAVPAGE